MCTWFCFQSWCPNFLSHSMQVVWRWGTTSRFYASLTHWGRLMHICISIIGSDNGLSPCRHQANIWTNAGIVLIRALGTNVSEILSEIHIFSFMKMHFKMASGKWRPFCLGLNVLNKGRRKWSITVLYASDNCCWEVLSRFLCDIHNRYRLYQVFCTWE